MPLVLLVWAYCEGLTTSVWVNQSDREEVRIRDGMSVSHSKWVLEDPLDRAPDVDDLIATREKLFGFSGKVMRDPFFASFVGLVDVDAVDRTTKDYVRVGALVLGCTTDGVVEDEDAGCSSPEIEH